MEGQQQSVEQSVIDVLQSMQAVAAQNMAFVQQLVNQQQQQQPTVHSEQAGGNSFLKIANKVVPTLPQFRGNTNDSVEFFLRECEEKFTSYGIAIDGDNTNLAVHWATSRFPSSSNVHYWWLNHCIQIEQTTNVSRFATTCSWAYFKEALIAKYGFFLKKRALGAATRQAQQRYSYCVTRAFFALLQQFRSAW
jgi:hypothetical protein